MLDRKYRKSYIMNFIAFLHLVSKFTSFICFTIDILVRPHIPIMKHISLVIYRLAHDFSYKIMDIYIVVKNLSLEYKRLLFVGTFLIKINYLLYISTHLKDTY